jgi:hypothetical protein
MTVSAVLLIPAVLLAGCSSAPEATATTAPTTVLPAETPAVTPPPVTTATEAPTTGIEATVSPTGTVTANQTAPPVTTVATTVPTTVGTMAMVPSRTVPATPVIGTWGYDNKEGKAVTLTFEPGGQFSGTIDNDQVLSGTWRKTGDNIYVVSLSSGGTLGLYYEPESDTLYNDEEPYPRIVRI